MRRGAWLLAIAALASCEGADAPSSLFAVADSAGVEVVATSVPVWTAEPGWSVAPQPSVTIGQLEGDPPYLFSNIASVLGLPDGSILVADGQTAELRFFDEDGMFRRSVGGRGEGPGEYSDIAWAAQCGQGLQVLDRRNRRLTMLTSSGELLGTAPLVDPVTGSVPYRSRCGRDGSLVIAGWGEHPAMQPDVTFDFYAQEAPVYWLSSPEADPIPLGDYVSSERILTYNPSRGSGGSAPHPFGRAVAFAVGASIYIGNADRLQVEERDRAGRLLRLMRGPDDDLIIDEAFLYSWRATQLAPRDSARRAQLEANEMPMPPRAPAYTEVRIDPLGYIWVERFQVPWSAQNRWGVFSPTGEFLGHLTLPAGFQLMDVSENRVLGVNRDEFDVERVEVYALDRGR